MSALIASALLIIGSIFCLVAAVGMLRLPDTLIRMHAATKAGTLGAGFILAAEAVIAAELGTTLKAIAAIVFLLLTAPVAAHLIGRAAYHQGIHCSPRPGPMSWGTACRAMGRPLKNHPPTHRMSLQTATNNGG
jgi:multicomponent Na+:H+ antiporter subunit G